jgi:hypothetical protein
MVPFGDDLDMTNKEIQNVSLQKLAADPASPVNGQIWHNTVLDAVRFRSAGNTYYLPFLGAIAGGALVVGGTGVAGNSKLAAPANHTHDMPGVASGSAAGFMSTAHFNLLAGATPSSTANTLALRDGSGRVQVADPVSALDAVNKQTLEAYVTQSSGGSARLKTTGNIASFAGGAPSTVDGTAVGPGDLILVASQTTTSQNGVYSVQTVGTGSDGTWVRAPGYDTWGELVARIMIVEQGSTQNDTLWLCTADRTGGTLGTTAVTYSQMPSPMDILAGNGLIKTGNLLEVNVDNSTIEIVSDALRLKDTGTTYAKFQNLPGVTVFGRSANSTGVGGAITAAANDRVLGRTGDALSFLQVSNAMLANMSARSIKANATNASAAATDLQSSAADQVLVSTATSVLWGTVNTAGLTNKAVTYAKFQDVTATNRVLGRITAGAGVVEELTPANLLTIIESGFSGQVVRVFSALAGNTVSSQVTFNHNLGAGATILGVLCRRVSDNGRYEVGWTIQDSNNLNLTGVPLVNNGLSVAVLYIA